VRAAIDLVILTRGSFGSLPATNTDSSTDFSVFALLSPSVFSDRQVHLQAARPPAVDRRSFCRRVHRGIFYVFALTSEPRFSVCVMNRVQLSMVILHTI
jgi:hypothetical protein